LFPFLVSRGRQVVPLVRLYKVGWCYCRHPCLGSK
jgi:hypothetical protein